MTKDDALKLALGALESIEWHDGGWGLNPDLVETAITAIKEALAQPAQEPVGKVTKITDNGFKCEFNQRLAAGTKLYTTPPQRPWVGLTDDEFKKIIDDAGFIRTDLLMIGACVEQLVDLLEATLRSKNT